MKRLRLLGLVLMAVFALGASAAATASAEERGVLTLISETKVLAEGENLANTATLTASGSTITCKKLWILDISLEPVAGSGGKHFNLGKDANLHFSECSSAGGECNTEEDKKGIILVLVDTHLVNLLDKAAGKLIPGFFALILNMKLENKPILILCGLIDIEVRGAAPGVAEPLSGGVITLAKEVEEVGLLAKPNIICDTENETVCEKLKKEELLEANFGFGFEDATEETQLETVKLKPDVLWDD